MNAPTSEARRRHARCRITIAPFVTVAMHFVYAGCDRPQYNITQANSNDPPAPWLVDITSASGLQFTHTSGAKGEHDMPEVMGAGAAMFDYDNDGDLDIYLINGAHDLGATIGSDAPRNQLFRHDDGMQFTNVTETSGLGDTGYGMGVAIGDYDNDGWTDVYVTNDGEDQLYHNRGDGTFENVTEAAHIRVLGWSCSAAFLDYDRDGYLDLFVTQYVVFRPAVKCTDLAGRPEYCGPRTYPPTSDVLLHNNGNGTFTDVSAQAGLTTTAAAGLGVVCADFDGDAWIDIYVANDAYPNNLWINRHNGTFVDVASMWGCALNSQGDREAGMGVVAADLDGDQQLDLFVTHLVNESNTLYHMIGPGKGMADATGASGLATTSMKWTGFGVVATDLDLDGMLDLLVVNGRVKRGAIIPGAAPPPPWDVFAEPNLVYLNAGDGHFTPLTEHAEQFVTPIEISRGLCAGDLDHDGRIDLLVSNTEGPAHLYHNDMPRRGHWMSIRAIDPRYKREAIGASVLVESANQSWIRTVMRNSGYLSASSPDVHVGLGDANRVNKVTITWPDGLVEAFVPTCVDCAVEFNRGEGEAVAP